MLRTLVLGFIIIAIIATILHVAQSCGSDLDKAVVGKIGEVADHIISGSAAEDASGVSDVLTLRPLVDTLGGE